MVTVGVGGLLLSLTVVWWAAEQTHMAPAAVAMLDPHVQGPQDDSPALVPEQGTLAASHDALASGTGQAAPAPGDNQDALDARPGLPPRLMTRQEAAPPGRILPQKGKRPRPTVGKSPRPETRPSTGRFSSLHSPV